MRVFKSKSFTRFAGDEEISDAKLCEVADAAESGEIDANLGAGVLKMRIARANEGKSGGYRAIIYFRKESKEPKESKDHKEGKTFFVYGFLKSDRDNISRAEEKAFKKAAKPLLTADDAAIARMLKNGTFEEVFCHGKNKAIQK